MITKIQLQKYMVALLFSIFSMMTILGVLIYTAIKNAPFIITILTLLAFGGAIYVTSNALFKRLGGFD